MINRCISLKNESKCCLHCYRITNVSSTQRNHNIGLIAAVDRVARAYKEIKPTQLRTNISNIWLCQNQSQTLKKEVRPCRNVGLLKRTVLETKLHEIISKAEDIHMQQQPQRNSNLILKLLLLCRELNELKKPSSDNPDILRFFKYMKAAKDGQDGEECVAHNGCPSLTSKQPSPAMLTTFNDINKLVQARKIQK